MIFAQTVIVPTRPPAHRDDGGGQGGDDIAEAAQATKEPDDAEGSHRPVYIHTYIHVYIHMSSIFSSRRL